MEPSITQPEARADDRTPLLVWLLVLVLWCVQVRYPQLGYPGTGWMLAGGLAAIVTAVAVWYWRERGAAQKRFNPAAVAGFAFVLCYLVRWAAMGFAAAGDDPAGTVLQVGAWALTAYLMAQIGSVAAARTMQVWLLRCVSIVAAVCGVHALLQYLYFYDQSLVALRESLQGAEPTPLQMGLIHHFQLKRVASVWGDPNILAGFSAMSIPASVALLINARTRVNETRGAEKWVWPLVGLASIAFALVSIGLSGSRGGILDAGLGLVSCGLLLLGRRPRLAGATIVGIAAAVLMIAKVADAQTTKTAAQQSAWTWRSNTIDERLSYMHVGAAMFKQNPVIGLGPGSVDLYFGRYKPAEARESKYLHNWVVQLAAETGIIGVALAVGFVGLLLWQARRSNNVSERALVIMVIVFVFDALLQLSFSHREMMAVFGLCCGSLLATGEKISAGGETPRKRYNNALALVAGMALSLAILALVVPRLLALDYRQRANDAIESKEPAEAIRLLRNSQQWEPNHPAAYLSLAQMEEQGGQLSSALMLIEKAVRLQPESAAARAALAHVQMRSGNYEEAIASMKEALARYPANPNYNGQMAELLLAYAEVEAGSGLLVEMEAAKRNRALAVDYARKAAQYSPGVPGAEHWPAFYDKLQKSGDN